MLSHSTLFQPKSKSQMLPWIIEVKTAEEIVKMRAAGKVARQVLDIAGQAVRAGISTDEIDAIVHAETIKVRRRKKRISTNPCELIRVRPSNPHNPSSLLREEHIHLP